MPFYDLLLQAQASDGHAYERIAALYEPLLRKESRLNGHFDEDLYQDQLIVLLRCIRQFDLSRLNSAAMAA